MSGNGGNDRLDGGEGQDVAILSGNEEEYTITREAGSIIIEDKETDRDGKDTLINIERIQFADNEVAI